MTDVPNSMSGPAAELAAFLAEADQHYATAKRSITMRVESAAQAVAEQGGEARAWLVISDSIRRGVQPVGVPTAEVAHLAGLLAAAMIQLADQ